MFREDLNSVEKAPNNDNWVSSSWSWHKLRAAPSHPFFLLHRASVDSVTIIWSFPAVGILERLKTSLSCRSWVRWGSGMVKFLPTSPSSISSWGSYINFVKLYIMECKFKQVNEMGQTFLQTSSVCQTKLHFAFTNFMRVDHYVTSPYILRHKKRTQICKEKNSKLESQLHRTIKQLPALR